MNKTLLVFCLAAATGCGQVILPPLADEDGGGGPQPGDDNPGNANPGSQRTNTFSGSIFDERNDQLDTTSGDLHHVHQGDKTVLGGDGCPAIYKYDYLAEGHPIVSENIPNPVAWDFDGSVAAYRVVDASAATVIDWVATTDSHIVLTDAISDKTGELHLEVRTNTGDVVSTCWTHHPLTGSLSIGAAQNGALFGMQYASGAALAKLVNAGSFDDNAVGIEVANLPITQFIDRPLSLSLEVPAPTGTSTATTGVLAFGVNPQPANYTCPGGYGVCYTGDVGFQYPVANGALAGTWQLLVIDIDSGQRVCRSLAATPTRLGCQIPARIGAARHFKASLTLAAEHTLSPKAITPLQEDTFADLPDAGWTPAGVLESRPGIECSKTDALGTTCLQTKDYSQYTVLYRGSIAFNAITFVANNSNYVLPAAIWDSGVGP